MSANSELTAIEKTEKLLCEALLLFRQKTLNTVKTLNIGTPRPATVFVLNIKQINFTMK